MRDLRGEARRAVRVAGLAALTSAMLPPFTLLLRAAPDEAARAALRRRWVGAWARALLELFGVDVVVLGAVPPGGRGRLVVANHRSTADILVLLSLFGGRVVSRADLARWPLVGAAARAAGTLFVDRADASSGATTLRSMAQRLAAADTVVVFAEGTTFAGDEVRPFHAGGFVAAARAGADVVPVGLAYARGSQVAFVDEGFVAHLSRVAAAPPTRLVVAIGEPLAPSAHPRAAALRDATHDAVSRLVAQARSSVDAPPRA